MERITYRITLDTHKNGIQRTLQGFETGDNMSRRIAINLMASGDTFEIPMDHVTAMMYVTTPDSDEPSINECTIEDNTIIYDVLPTELATEGIVSMQLKLIEGDMNGARKVLLSPKFSMEVMENNVNDGGAEKTTTFTALEGAIAKANAVYDARMTKFEVTDDCYIRVHYADGTFYENDYFHDAIFTENAIMSESFAKGGTGYRDGEDIDNAKFYKDTSQSLFERSKELNKDCRDVLAEVSEKTAYTSFGVDFESGHLTYLSQNYTFTIDEKGDLQFESMDKWSPEDATKKALDKLTAELSNTIKTLQSRVDALERA